ncbi:MAG: hypothetical protein EXS36_05880 [Pedosphaera sp.]|nr:hypothetical protein [Pedosphaera sp.]
MIPSSTNDRFFQQLVAMATGLAFAGMLASLAAVEVGAGGKLVLRWHWAIAPLVILGLVIGVGFWRLVFRSAAHETNLSHRRLRQAAAGLAGMAITSFLYPLRFVQPDRRNEVLIGLVLAIVVLSFVGWLVWKTISWVTENELKDGESE